ncbi:MAG: GNAT family N-acetyltransferase [Blastocatellia bacterium]|nr:MAG: GNAT family N-acetyltransferase [Blastocatellia bacterium]
MPGEWVLSEFTISTDRDRLDVNFIHQFLTNHAYWALGRSLDTVTRSVDNSLNFGLYSGNKQIGFARVVTDYATFAWLADVFVLPEYRGKGLGKWLIETISSVEELQGFRRWLLATHDAHGLYRQFGFNNLSEPDRWMEKRNSQI